jgi:hypothetical protein
MTVYQHYPEPVLLFIRKSMRIITGQDQRLSKPGTACVYLPARVSACQNLELHVYIYRPGSAPVKTWNSLRI